MCYWELTIFNGKKQFRKWDSPAKRNRDGYGFYCVNCREQSRSLSYKVFTNRIKTHKGHLVLIHFRLKSCGSINLHNVQPIVIGDHVVVHNGDFTSKAYDLDWRDLMGLGFSDSWILATELASAYDHTDYEEYEYYDNKGVAKKGQRAVPKSDMERSQAVLKVMKDISKSDFIANYLMITPDTVIASIGSGSFNDSKEDFYIDTTGYDTAQFIYSVEDLKMGNDTPLLFTEEDYSKQRIYSGAYGSYNNRYWDRYYWYEPLKEEKDDKKQSSLDDHDLVEVTDEELDDWLETTINEIIFTKDNKTYVKTDMQSLRETVFSNDIMLNQYIQDELFNEDDKFMELGDLIYFADLIVEEYGHIEGRMFHNVNNQDDTLPFYEDMGDDYGLRQLFGDSC